MTEKLKLAEQILLESIEYKSGQLDYRIDNNFLYIWSKDDEDNNYLSLDIVHKFDFYYVVYATIENGKILILVS